MKQNRGTTNVYLIDWLMKLNLLLTGVCLKFRGEARVYWSESSGSGDNKKSTTYSASDTYVDEKVYVFGSRKSINFSVIFDFIQYLLVTQLCLRDIKRCYNSMFFGLKPKWNSTVMI